MPRSRLAAARLAALLACLVAVAGTSLHERGTVRAWRAPLEVVVFPIVGDADPATRRHVEALEAADLAPLDAWGEREAARHGLALRRPFRTSLGPPIEALPPALAPGAGPLGTLVWSLRFRWWAWRHTPEDAPGGRGPGAVRVRLYTVYHADAGRALAHSLGLRKGLLGLVHAYAVEAQRPENLVVMAHELLHALGASDKYDATGAPRFPDGYAEPHREPLHPQRRAEIMAGRIPTGRGPARIAPGLDRAIVAGLTAREIGWLR